MHDDVVVAAAAVGSCKLDTVGLFAFVFVDAFELQVVFGVQ